MMDLLELNFNPWKKLSKEWFLVTAGPLEDYNTMTAAWGDMGVMWGKNVFTTVVRPIRHTYKYIETHELFTISFFDPEYKESLSYCGAHSGRDGDKASACGLTPYEVEADGLKTVAFKEAALTFVCKKIYRATIDEDSIIDESIWNAYKNEPFHVAYTGEILQVLGKE